MTAQRFDSIWDAIEETPAAAANMRLRAALMTALRDHIANAGISQDQAARQHGVTQPRISDLVRGKIDLSSLDKLVNMLAAAGMHVNVEVASVA